MNEKKWKEFFDLVKDIVSQEGSWQDKADDLKRRANQHGAVIELEELAVWADDGPW